MTENCPGTVPCDLLFNRAATISRAGCHGVVAISLPCRLVLAQKPCLLAACMSRHPTTPSTSRHSGADAGGGAARRLRVGPKAGPGAAARPEAGNCGEGFACLFQAYAVFSHQVCTGGSVFFLPPAVQGGYVGTYIVYAAYFGSFSPVLAYTVLGCFHHIYKL